MDNTVLAGVTVPLPIGNRNQSGIARAEAEQKVSETNLSLVRNRTLAEVEAAYRAYETAREQVRAYEAGLLNSVFDAIVDSSIRQMDAYAKLVAGVAESLDEFTDENSSDNEARDHLRDRLPHFFQSSTTTKRRRVRLASSRQQLLATMVLMGINRIVVTDGRIPARITK